jgi:hypothetical protein
VKQPHPEQVFQPADKFGDSRRREAEKIRGSRKALVLDTQTKARMSLVASTIVS